MDYNKIKNLLNTEGNDPLPSNLDWDNVEMGIMDIMQSLDDDTKNIKEDKSDRNKIIIVFFLVMGGMLGLFCLSQRVQSLEEALVNIDKKQVDKDVITNADRYTTPIVTNGKIDEQNGNVNVVNNSDVDTGTNAAIAADIDDDLVRNNDVDYRPWSTQVQTFIDAKSGSKKVFTPFTKTKLDVSSRFNEQDGNLDTQIQNNNLQRASLSNSFALENKQISSNENKSLIVSALPMISLRSFTLERPIIDLNFDIQATNQLSQPKEEFTESLDRLIWESGLLYWNEGYGNLKPEREPYESTLPSLQLQISYIKGLKKSYFTQIGLQYQQIESKLEYETTLEDYTTVNLVDTIIQVQNNLWSGEQSVIKGDVEVPVDAVRTIVHHNTTKLLKISAAVGRKWQYKSLSADAYLGVGVTRRISSTGRTLLNNNIIDYDGSTNDFLNNQFMVDGNIGLRLQYHLSPRIGISSGIQIQKSISSWSKEIDVDMRPTMIGFQLGIGYSL